MDTERNPNWSRDELVLALELYFRIGPNEARADNADVIVLSELLNALPIHRGQKTNRKFRNPNGVVMKLGNFARLDPDYSGTGLTRGSKLDADIWDEFSGNKHLLRQTAEAIRHNYVAVGTEAANLDESDAVEKEVFREGRILTRLHLLKERNIKAVKAKKKQVKKQTGRLACEVCGFDFVTVYGELGEDFAECHHIVPLSELKHEREVNSSELAIVCANCHRMLHRRQPVLSILELRSIVQSLSAHS